MILNVKSYGECTKSNRFFQRKQQTTNKESLSLTAECSGPEETTSTAVISEDDSMSPFPYRPPAKTFIFPKMAVGARHRSCQHQWLDKFTWLHYDTRY